MSTKDINLKEKFKQALTSTIKVISDDLEIKKSDKNSQNTNKFDLFELDNLNNKIDFLY